MDGGRWSHASNWDDNAKTLGYTVDNKPAVGAVAHRPFGNHVAWVAAVGVDSDGKTTITIEEYNWMSSGAYNSRTVSTDNWQFIHISDLSASVSTTSGSTNTTSIHEGSHIVDEKGKGYVVAGHSPVYVSDWNNVGGIGDYITVDQAMWDKMREYPKDGTYVRDYKGKVYVFIGGAPLWVRAWSNVRGLHETILVDKWTLDTRYGLQYYPLDGHFLVGGRSNKCYGTAGGAPLYIAKWDSWGGTPQTCDAVVDDEAIVSDLRAYPRNGTVVHTTHNFYVFAGGTALYFRDWTYIGGWRESTTIDDWELVNYEHTRAYPVDDTYVVSSADEKVYRVYEGTTTFVNSWADVGGVKPTTMVDEWAIVNQLHATK